MKQTATVFAAIAAAAALWLPSTAAAVEAPCELKPRAKCFGVESLSATLSTSRAGAHPDVSFNFDLKQDPESEPNSFGLRNAYAPTRNVRIELPPGLSGEPNVLGVPQQCAAAELAKGLGAECPNGSQVGVANIFVYQFTDTFLEPIYLMQPPGGDAVARFGFIAGVFPVFVDVKVRSESDYGLTFEIVDTTTEATLIRSETTTWGVPAAPSHNKERCTPAEAFLGCKASPSRPPGSLPLPLITNPTRCGVPLALRVGASSWAEPERFDTKSASFPEITECNRLPFRPSLTIKPTSHRPGAPTGLEATVRLPASDGDEVLEPSQMRAIRVRLPEGVAINPGAADGLTTCSESQVKFGTREASQCPSAAKVADAEFDIPALPRRMKGAVYLREPEPDNLFRVWVVADDLGAHVKLPGELEVDEQTGQIETVVLDIPQAPLREAKFFFKSGFRAPLVNPPACGTYQTAYEFTPWSGEPPVKASSPMAIDEGCEGLGGFKPKLSAGTAQPAAGQYSPFVFTLTREDGEQNPASLDIVLPQGLAAKFAGIPRCQGAEAVSGQCPAASRIGRAIVASGAGAAPLWVPQPDKRPTAVYLAGPYRNAPFSVVAVVPAQAGPFDLGDQVVRSAVYVDRVKAQGIVKSDALPQIIEGIPIRYRTIRVELDRPGFTLNPTNCELKSIEASVTSSQGTVAKPSSPFAVADCAKLPFKPELSFRLYGGTKRAAHPRLRAVLKVRPGDANIGALSVALPRSEFLDQSHIGTVCTRVQFAVNQCPADSIYGHAEVKTPLFEQPLSGPVYLRSSSHELPDLVVRLAGEVEIELSSRVDSVNGGIRNTFEVVPDAPVSSAIVTLESGKKGLLVNSTDLCAKARYATAKLIGQNGRRLTLHPKMKASCGKRNRRAHR